jgi:leucyl/phenylalanyl-tRNA--protein transferase
VERLRDRGFGLLDVQWGTAHLEQFGVVEISRRRYLALLREALTAECRFAE